MAATPNLRHVEWFHDHARIEALLLDGAPAADGGAMRPRLDRAGHGMSLTQEAAERYRAEG